MKVNCTELFIQYREIARLVWNFGLWPNPKLRKWDSLELYSEAMARLFECIVLHSLGYHGRIANKHAPGDIDNFLVEVTSTDIPVRIDVNRPDDAGHIWKVQTLRLEDPRSYKFRFVAFFEWNLLGLRNFHLLEVDILQLESAPRFIGHHALLEVERCSIWFVNDEVSDDLVI